MDLPEIEIMKTQEVGRLPSMKLLQLQKQANMQLVKAKSLKSKLTSALNLKFKDQAKLLLAQDNKDFGTIHFKEGFVHIKSEIKKTVKWDQAKLETMAQRIRESGGDPTEYIDISYKVSESKYKSWPSHLREAFAAARTVKDGSHTFELSDIEGDK